VDVLFVNGLPFFVKLSRGIKLMIVEVLTNQTMKEFCNALKKAIIIYCRGGYMVRKCLMDMEFNKLVHNIEKVIVNSTAFREHVGHIEHFIITIKEHSHCMSSLTTGDF
jgi:hypothetical protein